MSRTRTPVLLAACVSALALPAAAVADEPIADVQHDTPLASHDGWSALSEQQGERYQLVLRSPGGELTVPSLPTSSKPWDVSLGPDAHGDVAAVYRRCTSSGCDVYRLDPETGRSQKLESVSSPSHDEATPAIWGSTIAFTRRIDGCDVPYVKTLGSSEASRRLLRSKCLQTPAGHVAVRGSAVVVSSRDGSSSEVRRYTGGDSRVLLRTGGQSRFGQVVAGDRYVTTVLHGTGAAHAFVRVPASGGSETAVSAGTSLTGGFAAGAYVEAQDAETDTCAVPCRVVALSSSPFGHAQRSLAPRLTVAYSSPRGGNPPSGRALPFVGTLSRPVVQDGRVVRSEPVAGVTVDLRRRTTSGFDATTYRAVTGADGSYRIVVPAPIPREPWFTAVAQTSPVATWAGTGTIGLATP
jgi:hypothetical protein